MPENNVDKKFAGSIKEKAEATLSDELMGEVSGGCGNDEMAERTKPENWGPSTNGWEEHGGRII